MFVVNTTSATAGKDAAVDPEILPRKRVPSSRRRNPGAIMLVSLNFTVLAS
jgi:hypothetical protein